MSAPPRQPHEGSQSPRSARRSPASRSRRSTALRTSATHDANIGNPGEYPFTRGVYPTMYRGRLWTMRQFAGFGTAEETNERFRYLLDHGQTGLCTAFDMPSLMGHDSDHPAQPRRGRPRGRRDRHRSTTWRRSSSGIDLGDVTVSMTINAPAAMMLAMYVVAAEQQRRAGATSSAARSRPTSSRSTSPRRSGASRSTRRCACWAT